MADAKIAGGAVVLSVNADKLAAGLADAKKKVGDFGKKTEGLWGKLGDKFGGGGGGFLAKSLGAGFFGGIAGALAIRAMNFIATGISDVISQTSKWTQELGRANHHATMLAASMDRATKIRDEWTGTFSGADLKGRLKTDESLAFSGKSTADAAAEHIRKRLELLNSFGVTNTMASLMGHRDRDKAFLEAGLTRAEAEAGKFAGRLDEVREKLRRLDPSKDPAVKAGLDKYITDLTFKMDTLGMTADEVAHKLIMDKGGAAGDLGRAGKAFAELTDKETVKSAKDYADELEKMADALQEGARSAERLKATEIFGKDGPAEFGAERARMMKNLEFLEGARANKPAHELLKNLQMQRMAIGGSAHEAQLLELRLGGAAKHLVDAAALEAGFLEHAAMKNDFKRLEPKLAGAMLADSTDAYSLEMKHKLGRPGAADKDKGMGIFDVVMVMGKVAATLERIEKKKAGVM